MLAHGQFVSAEIVADFAGNVLSLTVKKNRSTSRSVPLIEIGHVAVVADDETLPGAPGNLVEINLMTGEKFVVEATKAELKKLLGAASQAQHIRSDKDALNEFQEKVEYHSAGFSNQQVFCAFAICVAALLAFLIWKQPN